MPWMCEGKLCVERFPQSGSQCRPASACGAPMIIERPDPNTPLSPLPKVVLVVAAMMFAYPILLVAADPVYSWCESVRVGFGIGGIGWILDPAIRATAVFSVSFLWGLLSPADRWVVRPAATILVLWLLLCATFACVRLSSIRPPESVSLFVRAWVLPLTWVAVIVVLFSPFFHDCGRTLRSSLGRRGGQGCSTCCTGGSANES